MRWHDFTGEKRGSGRSSSVLGIDKGDTQGKLAPLGLFADDVRLEGSRELGLDSGASVVELEMTKVGS